MGTDGENGADSPPGIRHGDSIGKRDIHAHGYDIYTSLLQSAPYSVTTVVPADLSLPFLSSNPPVGFYQPRLSQNEKVETCRDWAPRIA
ncbi:hypothetical protein ACJ72_01574 [Emergomyces africanus]|uniref:Uncharacterized protein n=1 Tax=Emergomyces africanus TaxID=1955775 RepID=A0A1B7P4X1_9EURO|nr:hypothetical protein ACJ72_01574 [Emergomyces africanus]